MSCFGAVAATTSGTRGGRRPWRWWRSKCAGIAASVGSRIRRSIKGLDGRRRRSPLSSSSTSVQRGWCHHRQHRTFEPIYVDELYNHHQPAKALNLNVVVQQEPEPEPGTSGSKLTARPGAAGGATRATGSGKATARVGAATTTATGSVGARASGKQARTAAAAGVGAMRSVLMRSPGRGGGVLGVVKGMGEVDLRAELFIRKFKEDMRLQSQFQAMLARGL